MTKFIKQCLTSTALVAILPGAAFAELSAIEVWDNWKSYTETFGQTIAVGSENVSGDTLTLNDVTISSEFPDGTMTGTIASIEFQERTDGTVAITMSPDFPMSVTGEPEDGETFDMTMIFRQSGTSIVASGDQNDISYDYLTSKMEMEIANFVVDGNDIKPTVNVTLSDVDGKYASSVSDVNTITSQFAASELGIDMNFVDPEGSGTVQASGTIANIRSDSNSSFPLDFKLEDPTAMFGGAFDFSGSFEGGASSYSMDFKDDSDDFSATATSAGSALDFTFADGGMEYGGSTTDTNYSITSSQIPLPEITFGMAESAFRIEMPLSEGTDEASDYGMLVKIIGLEVSDLIWGMIDGGGVLPRNPANLVFDVSGKMNWLIDVFDPEAMASFSGEMPVELYDLSINDVTLSVAGADANATGNFTFDNTDLTTFDGLPAPTGSIDVNLSGINGLIDNLIAMGLMPQDQAMGARMMLGLFARPGQGEDNMTSKLEVKGDGSVFANGQQLK